MPGGREATNRTIAHISFLRIIPRRSSTAGKEGTDPCFPTLVSPRFLSAPNSPLARRGQTPDSHPPIPTPATRGLSPSCHLPASTSSRRSATPTGNQRSVPRFPPAPRLHSAGVVKMRRANGNAGLTDCRLPEIIYRSQTLTGKVTGYAGIFLVSNVQFNPTKPRPPRFPIIHFISRSFPYPFHP